MSRRQQLIRDAFGAVASGDLQAFEELLDPRAQWVGVPGSGCEGETPTCGDRSAIIRLLGLHHRNGRSFEAGELIESGNRVAAALAVSDPQWSAPVELFKVFTFQEGEDVVVRLNDCIDVSYALQVLAA